jgi:succinyl-CoA synthetase alpha subunit
MGILIDRTTRVVVQGITGRDGSFHTRQMVEYGTQVVAGVTPGKGGETIEGIPVFDTMAEAVRQTGANTSVVYVPPRFAADALFEAADSGVRLTVCITEGVPANDMLRVNRYYEIKGVSLVGPNCPGLITPGVCKVGILPGPIHQRGPVGVVSRSGTLTYEVVHHLTRAGLGQSTCIGIGGDPIIGMRFIDVLELFEKDRQTEAVVLIGEIGGNDEEIAAEFIQRQMTKPVVAFIAGRTAPPGKRMGHAGAIIAGGSGTASEKITAFRAAGVEVAESPSEVPEMVAVELKDRAKRKSARVITLRPLSGAAAAKTRAGRSRSAPARTKKPPRASTVSSASAAGRATKSKSEPSTKPKKKPAPKKKPSAKRKPAGSSKPKSKSKTPTKSRKPSTGGRKKR